nr:bifunctional 3,4-dihydroxy-2-butanone-4-phosphate synthase/GTP cyclohydrolase II [Mycobacterium sp. 852013-50091_SCH5140682]
MSDQSVAGYSSVDEAAAEIARGGMVVVLDDEDRENEADLIMAAEHADPVTVAFFLQHTSGFLCTAITKERAMDLRLEPMVPQNTDPHRTAFLVSVDYGPQVTTGISAADRAATIRALAAEQTRPEDLTRPGHVLPLQARQGGVLTRAGHTEAGTDLARIAGCTPAALLCEIVTTDRVQMLRGNDAIAFGRHHDLPVIAISQIIAYRRNNDSALIERTGQATIPTQHGDFHATSYRDLDGVEHLALRFGDADVSRPVIVRVHSECLTGDVLGSLRCDCGRQLSAAIEMIAAEGNGILVYLRGHEGRGIGIGHKLRAYELQQRLGVDTVDANLMLGLPVDQRDYTTGAAILADLGVRQMRLITNNPEKYKGLSQYGLDIVERISIPPEPTMHNIAYLTAKRNRMGHHIDLPAVHESSGTPTYLSDEATCGHSSDAR